MISHVNKGKRRDIETRERGIEREIEVPVTVVLHNVLFQ
jgi:hypothetical protein